MSIDSLEPAAKALDAPVRESGLVQPPGRGGIAANPRWLTARLARTCSSAA